MKNKLNLLWALPWGFLTWIMVELLTGFLIFLPGLVFMPLALAIAHITLAESRLNQGQQIAVFKNGLLQTMWGNWEDGLSPLWWIQAMPAGRSMWLTRYLWFWRNPVGNARFWPIISTLPKHTVRWCGTLNEVPEAGVAGWFVAWQFPYVGFYWACSTWGLWLGWKLNPRDAQADPPMDYRYWGIGTACILLRF
jgi:hypothetical protein